MRLTKTLVAIALAATTATSAMAGGLAPSAPATTVVVPVQPPAQRSSWGIILPILGAVLLIGLATSGGSDDEPTTTE